MSPIVLTRLMDASEAAARLSDADLERFADCRLGDLVEGAFDLAGSPDLIRTRTVAENTVRIHTDGTWLGLASPKIGEALLWRQVGVTKIKAMLSLLAAGVRGEVASIGIEDESPGRSAVGEMIGIAAAWAISHGHDDLPAAISSAAANPTQPGIELWFPDLVAADLREVAGDALALFDIAALVNNYVESLSERDRRILECRLAVDQARGLTLEELGGEFGVTRERIRQLEFKVKQGLAVLLADPRSVALRERVDEIAASMGDVCPIDAAADEVLVADDSLLDEVIAYFAGPYQLVDGWYVKEDTPDPAARGRKGFEEVADDGVAELEAFGDALRRDGVVEGALEAVMAVATDVHVRDGLAVDWKGHNGDRAVRILRARRESMSAEELHTAVADGTGLNTLKNRVSDDERLQWVGKSQVGLAEWGGEEWYGTVDAMISELEQRGPSLFIEELADEFAERFGISPVSVRMYATGHPVFIAEAGMVRLRRADESYEVTNDMETSRNCYLVDGSWAVRIPVDHDVTRGSGRAFPEAFAAHLGLRPGYSTRVPLGAGDVGLAWHQQPVFGSIRVAVLDAGGEANDFVFIRRRPGGALDLRLLRASEVDMNSAAERICLLVGGEAGDPESWKRVLAEAIGFGPFLDTPIGEIRDRLLVRGDVDLVALVDEVAGGLGG